VEKPALACAIPAGPIATHLDPGGLAATGKPAMFDAPLLPAAAAEPLADLSADPSGVTGLSGLAERLEALEAYRGQMDQAVDGLVSAILETREQLVPDLRATIRAQVGEVMGEPLAAISEALTLMNRRLTEFEQQLQLERACRDLSEVARAHPKIRSVIFVSGRFFGDNLKYAYLATLARAEAAGIELWMLPQNATVEAEVMALGGRCLPPTWTDWRSEHVTTALSAAVIVTSDHLLGPNPYLGALLAGARQIQLWHGVSIKEIGYRNLPDLARFSAHTARVLRTAGHYAWLVGTAPGLEPEWRRWFGFERYSDAGYPRNDVLYREPTAGDLVNVDQATLARMRALHEQGKPVYLYTPTFRDASRGDWILAAGIDRVAAAVAGQGGLLVVNLHPVEQPQQARLAAQLPEVAFVRPDSDAYPLLRHSTALITDYSSLMFDYMHLDRPIVLFRPDDLAYQTQSRKLFAGKLDTLPAPVVSQADALISLLAEPADLDGGGLREVRQRLREELFSVRDGSSADRVLALLEAELDRVAGPL
jgi:CDP-glycerol glycerophosphotransferase